MMFYRKSFSTFLYRSPSILLDFVLYMQYFIRAYNTAMFLLYRHLEGAPSSDFSDHQYATVLKGYHPADPVSSIIAALIMRYTIDYVYDETKGL